MKYIQSYKLICEYKLRSRKKMDSYLEKNSKGL